MMHYQFADLGFEMRTSDKRKSYGVTVDRDSSLLLHVPRDYSEVLIPPDPVESRNDLG